MQIWIHAQDVWIIWVSRFSNLMFISLISDILVWVLVKIEWCIKSDRGKPTQWDLFLPLLPPTFSWIHNSLCCGLTCSTHPPFLLSTSYQSFGRLSPAWHLREWDHRATPQGKYESRWHKFSAAHEYRISKFHTMAIIQQSAECSLRRHSAPSCQK